MSTRATYSKGGAANYTTSLRSEYGATIEGLKPFARALKKLGEEYPTALRQANYDLASEVVRRSKLRAHMAGRQAASAARSLRARRSTNQAMVVGGGARMPYFFGAEFGAKQYTRFPRWRGNQFGGWEGGPGYFLHPTLRAEARPLIDEYMDRLQELASEAFPGSE